MDQRRTLKNEPEIKKTGDDAPQRWRRQTVGVKKRERKKTCQHWRKRWRIDTMTRRLHRKARKKTNYSHQKQYRQHENQQNDTNQKTKIGRKTILWTFWATNRRHLTRENVYGEKKGNRKREIESLLIVAQNNAIRTNHIKARIDKTQQNSRWRLCGDRDETINHIISECSKLSQKEYKTRLGGQRWSTGNRARNWNLTILTNGIRTTQNLSWIIKCTNSTGIL